MNLEESVEELKEHVLYLMQTCEKLALRVKVLEGGVESLEGDVESLSHSEILWDLVDELTHNLAKRFGVSAVDVLYMPPRP